MLFFVSSLIVVEFEPGKGVGETGVSPRRKAGPIGPPETERCPGSPAMSGTTGSTPCHRHHFAKAPRCKHSFAKASQCTHSTRPQGQVPRAPSLLGMQNKFHMKLFSRLAYQSFQFYLPFGRAQRFFQGTSLILCKLKHLLN